MIDQYLQRHEQFLKQLINNSTIPAEKIHQAMQYAIFPGGKRIRPILIYLIGELNQIDLNILDVLSAAVELTHCYSLIHDDLPAMDNDDIRRGKASCHKAFDEATAILVGDGMQALAIEILITYLEDLLAPSQLVNIIMQLVKASGVNGMVSGQSLDLTELINPSISEEQLCQIHHLKTGKLIEACLEMILAAKPIDETATKALRTYTNHLGLVFQMQDDYLDYYAPVKILGKGRSSDHANQKTTFATIFSKDQLEQKIAYHFQIALAALEPFAEQAKQLVFLTKQLQARTELNT